MIAPRPASSSRHHRARAGGNANDDRLINLQFGEKRGNSMCPEARVCPDSRSATVREASSPTRPATLARPDRGTAAGAMNGKERNEGAFLSIFEGTTVPTTESPYETSDQSRRPSLRKLLYCDKSHSLSRCSPWRTRRSNHGRSTAIHCDKVGTANHCKRGARPIPSRTPEIRIRPASAHCDVQLSLKIV